jgi:hypothetical protein
VAENKTRETAVSVNRFLNSVSDTARREECYTLIDLMKKITGEKPKMWGTSIIGFGKYHYKYKSGREGDICIAGFSPRKKNLTVYLMPSVDSFKPLISKLGNFKNGISCLYFKSLKDIDLKILEKILFESVKLMKEKYPSKVK